jgi:hypothetical protein
MIYKQNYSISKNSQKKRHFDLSAIWNFSEKRSRSTKVVFLVKKYSKKVFFEELSFYNFNQKKMFSPP